jgi:hypothetical protein
MPSRSRVCSGSRYCEEPNRQGSNPEANVSLREALASKQSRMIKWMMGRNGSRHFARDDELKEMYLQGPLQASKVTAPYPKLAFQSGSQSLTSLHYVSRANLAA